MFKHREILIGFLAVLVSGAAVAGQAIPNWPAPATWNPAKTEGGVHTMGDVTFALPFIGITPCRIADTRGNGFGGAYGPPSLAANANRDFTIVGQCGIPAGAQAVSFNFAALNVGAAGDLRVFPAGGALPLVSTLNYNANTPNIANAAIVPLGGGAITVRADAVSVDLIIDVNGYYPTGSSGLLLGVGQHFDVSGNTPPAFGMITTRNESATDGSMGVFGIMGATTGRTFAIQGVNSSAANHAAGVIGSDGSGVANPIGTPNFSAGVVGHGKNGVIGRTSEATGNGLTGVAQNGAGTNTAIGVVGTGTHAFQAILGDTVGPSPSLTIEPHPSNAASVVAYTSLTGNEAGTYFRGTAQTTDREFVIEVPEDFRIVTDPEGLTVQLTPVGAAASMFVVSEDTNQIVVRSSRDVRFHYLVQGVRAGHRGESAIRDTRRYSIFLPQTPDGEMLQAWPDRIKQRLIANGTYNPDGTINGETAERLGWAAAWREIERESRERSEKTAASLPR